MPPPFFPQDKSHLKTLVVCHYVMAGLSGMALLFIILHFAIMSSVFMNPEVMENGKDAVLLKLLVPIMGIFYVIMIFVGIALTTLNIISARYLSARKMRMLSIITAGFNCLGGIPGIALAVCTFIVLSRQSVIDAYQTSEPKKE